MSDEEDIVTGRRPLYNSAEGLSEKVSEYFKYIEGEYETKVIKTPVLSEDGTASMEDVEHKEWLRHPEPPTITGLALFLGFESRQSFYDYKKKEEFSYTIKKAALMIESKYEQSLWGGKPTGAIFALKNLGWNDSVNLDHTTKGDKINKGIDVDKLTPELKRALIKAASENE